MNYYLHNLFPDLYYKPEYDTLVLSSGSTKGFIMLGALQYYYDRDLLKKINKFVGTSVGSIISYLLCIGYQPNEIIAYVYSKNLMEKMKNIELANILEDKGISTFVYIQDTIEKMTRDKIGKYLTMKQLYEETKKELHICTYNVSKTCTEYINYQTYPDLPCIAALRMSSNIPLLFDRFKYMNNFYIDGAISVHFPIKFGVGIGKCILGINMDHNIKDEPDRGIINYFFKLLHIPMVENTKKEIEEIRKNKELEIDIVTLKTEYFENSNINFTFNIPRHDMMGMFTYGYKQIKKEE